MATTTREGTTPSQLSPDFTVVHQKVHIDLDPWSQQIKGRAELSLNPLSQDLKVIRLNCRQARILLVTVNKRTCASQQIRYTDPYERLNLPYQSDVHHHQRLRDRLTKQLLPMPAPELEISLPKGVRISPLSSTPAINNAIKAADPTSLDQSQGAKGVTENAPQFSPVTLTIDYEIQNIRDGLQFVGWDAEDLRFPHLYTRNATAFSASCLFPCVDSLQSKSTWEFSLRTPRTIGDALKSAAILRTTSVPSESPIRNFSEADCARELVVVCAGDVTDEIVDPNDASRKTTSFSCVNAISARHVGFALGPFEDVNLAMFRESDEDDRLGRNAVSVRAFCLPGRIEDVKTTCFPVAQAMDYIVTTFGSYPFPNYKICCVDALEDDLAHIAGLTLISNRLLFPDEIIDAIDHSTRQLVFGLATQWIGVNITPELPNDTWAVLGIAYFITDLFLRRLMGNNVYRLRQKRSSERLCTIDINRHSLFNLGQYISIDKSNLDLLVLKAPLVLFILDRRLTKASGSTGLSRIISRIFLNANVGDLPKGAISTAFFIRTCERLGHAKLESWFNQWIYGAGCPRFRVGQRFNKKRLVVEVHITQAQHDIQVSRDLDPASFMRQIKEDEAAIPDPPAPQIFTGPMTIRIHEADGTPYEHIIEIKEQSTKFDVPYNTKYKRLKRTRKQRDRGPLGLDPSAEVQDDALLYCLGDVLQSEDEVREWRLTDWSKEDEERMSGESYEWIRMDADFEWICQMAIAMPGYMFVSQLQQDRDVVAQYDTIAYLTAQKPHPLISTFLIRTLMDARYVYGIRCAAAAALANQAREEVNWIGLFHLEKAFSHLFCLSDSEMTSANSFADRAMYFVRCAIVRAIGKVRGLDGRSPLSARRFLFEKLRFNDNSSNEYSDAFYLATLLEGLATSIASAPLLVDELSGAEAGDDYRFLKSCLDEIDRYRRLDEWIPSYHNVLSTTALEADAALSQAKIVDRNPAEYLHYTQNGCFEELRIKAFACLMELGFSRNHHVFRWMIHGIAADSSPFVRQGLLRLFGEVLGKRAIGLDSPVEAEVEAQQAPAEALVIEQDGSNEARQVDLARRQTLDGAISALVSELREEEPTASAIWEAVMSPMTSLSEIADLLLICDLIYDTESKMVVTLRYPRKWRVARVPGAVSAGHRTCMLRFTRDGDARTKKLPKMPSQQAPIPPLILKPPTLKRESISGSKGTIITFKNKSFKKEPSVNGAGGAGSPPRGLEADKPKLKLIFKAPKV